MQGMKHKCDICNVFSFLKMVAFLAISYHILVFSAYAKGPESVADLADKLQKSVVNISTKQTVDVSQSVPLPNLPKGSPFRELFKDFFNFDNDGGGKPRKRSVQSLGSGFVISKDGLIVTNNHVIDDSDEIIVKFHDGQAYEAEIVGRDKKTDIAVLKIEPKEALETLQFGDSDKLRVGDWAMAIGNPFGLGGTVTLGIVSARNRDINSGPYDDYIQTDASINRGNSGGPLFDMHGKVIGVNTAIFSPSGGSVGIGFAIPSLTVKKIVDQLVKYGETRRGWLGVRIQEVTEGIKESFKLKEKKGALVANVMEDSPAEAAQFKAGDVILEFNNKPINSVRDLPIIVAETPVNKNVEVVVWRDGKIKSIRVTLGRLEDAEGITKSKKVKKKTKTKPENILNMELLEINKRLKEQYSIDLDAKGLFVVKLDQTSSAYDQGIRSGFLIKEIEGKKVTLTSQAREIINKARKDDRKYVLLLVEDLEKQTRFVPVEFD